MSSIDPDDVVDGASAESAFGTDLQRFVATLQVEVVRLGRCDEPLREPARRILRVLPASRTLPEFLMLRSVLVEFTARAIVRLGGSPDEVFQLAQAASGDDLGRLFRRSLHAVARNGNAQLAAISDLRAHRALSLIAARCSEPTLDARSIATAVGVSQQYLIKLLRMHCGCGFRIALRRARIQLVRTRLENGFDSIKEIATQVGYSSTSQLDRDFRIEYRVTPGRYRRQHLAQC